MIPKRYTKSKVKNKFGHELSSDNEANPQVECNIITNSNTNRPQTIVVKALQYKDKTKIFKSAIILKGQNTFMNNDFRKVT